MKKILVMLAAVFCVAGFAAESCYKTIGDLFKNKKYQEVINVAPTLKASAKTDLEKIYLAGSVVRAHNFLTPYANFAAYKAALDAAAKEFNAPTSGVGYDLAVLGIYYKFGDHAGALAYSQGKTDIRVKFRRAVAFSGLKKYEDAIKTYEEIYDAAPKSYHGKAAIVAALSAAKTANLPEKMFGLLSKAVNNGSIKDPEKIKEYLTIILDANLNATSVTPAKIKELLQTINRRYSKNLVPGSPSKWDDLLVLVRQTLETY